VLRGPKHKMPRVFFLSGWGIFFLYIWNLKGVKIFGGDRGSAPADKCWLKSSHESLSHCAI